MFVYKCTYLSSLQQNAFSPDIFSRKGGWVVVKYNWLAHKTEQQVGIKGKVVEDVFISLPCWMSFLLP